MRLISLSQRQARLLRDNLVANQEGYDYTDLVRLDRLAKKLTELQGDYALRMAELAREEKKLRRDFRRGAIAEEAANAVLLRIADEVEDLHEAAEIARVDLNVEDGDYRLIADKLGSVGRWTATDELRPVIIGLMEAVKGAASDQDDEAVKPFRRRTDPA